MNTREKIMDVALHMFSERGYEAVSIRDICGEVGIKESTLYYHFKNKKDILDSLVEKFRTHIDGLLTHVDEITKKPAKKKGKNIENQMVDSYMTMLTFKYLLNGELTEKRKKAYQKEVHDLMTRRLMA